MFLVKWVIGMVHIKNYDTYSMSKFVKVMPKILSVPFFSDMV